MTEFHAGDVVGGYRLEARLGGGGFGSVWRARHQETGRLVAIKLLTESPSSEDDARLRADVELLAASAASGSPHVVKVLDGGVSPVPYVVMEFVQGTSLAEELRQRQKLPQEEVIDIGTGIADALRDLNAAGIIHRDVKPSNVLIDRNGVVKLADFGIAKIVGFDAATLTGQMPLSIAYAAPEVWEGQAQHRSDLYAMAVLLYQCLTGTLPFRGAYAELFYQHRTKEPDLSALPDDAAPALVELIERCLQKDPAERPDAVECLALLDSAGQQVARPPVHEVTQEPDHFGPWIKLEPVVGRPWAWLCEHDSTGEEAVVEVHFSATADYGEGLRRAVAANPRLVAWGAERLLGTNRFILRPGEAWRDSPAGAFQFWVARGIEEGEPQKPGLTPYILLRAAENLSHLVEAAEQEGVPLRLVAGELSIRPDGTLLLRHPGFPRDDSADPEAEAISFLRAQSLPGALRRLVWRATDLDGLAAGLQELVQGPTPAGLPVTATSIAPPPATKPRRIPTPVLAGASLAFLIGAAALTAALVLNVFSRGGGGETTTSLPSPSPNLPSAFAACLDLALPAGLNAVDEACDELPAPAAFVFDPSCPRGQACKRTETDGRVTFSGNDRGVAYVDPGGNLYMASEDGSNVTSVTRLGFAEQPAWSPDGRYLAYVLFQPINPGAPPEDLRYASQLRVVEADRPANEGILLATTDAPAAADWQRLQVRSPQWSPDGQSIYALLGPYGRPGGSLVRIDLKLRGAEVDFGLLRSDVLRTEMIIPPGLQTIGLGAPDFGLREGIIDRFSIVRDGHFIFKVCDSDRPDRRCFLGQWDGRETKRLTPAGAPNVEANAIGPKGEPFFSTGSGSSARVFRANDTGQFEEVAGLPQTEVAASLTVSRADNASLIETAGQTLTLVPFGGGPARVWGRGSSPAWFVAPAANTRPGIVSLLSVPFATPTATPASTPTVTPSPTPASPALRPMNLNLSVRRAEALVPNATIIVESGGTECARAFSDANGRAVIAYPAPGAPVICRQEGSRLSFRVNNQAASGASFYSPLGSASLDITIP